MSKLQLVRHKTLWWMVFISSVLSSRALVCCWKKRLSFCCCWEEGSLPMQLTAAFWSRRRRFLRQSRWSLLVSGRTSYTEVGKSKPRVREESLKGIWGKMWWIGDYQNNPEAYCQVTLSEEITALGCRGCCAELVQPESHWTLLCWERHTLSGEKKKKKSRRSSRGLFCLQICFIPIWFYYGLFQCQKEFRVTMLADYNIQSC